MPPPKSRFLRAKSAPRSFFDREEILRVVDAELGALEVRSSVANLVGVGGIGKSRLLQECRRRAEERGYRTALLDLQVPALRQQAEALAVLRNDFGSQGVRFDRYDIAYAVLWQRLHPQLRVGPDLPFSEQSEALTAVVDAASGAPVFGTAIQLLRLLDASRSFHRRRRVFKIDDTLKALDDLQNVDLIDAVTYYFAEDLRDASAAQPYSVLVDAHEALQGADDTWLQDLVAQLDRGLTVIASRESIDWGPEWVDAIAHLPLEGLPMDDRVQLLREAGVTDTAEAAQIATVSEGLPFYLHLAADTSREAVPADKAGMASRDALLRRFLQHVRHEEIKTLELLSVARAFDFEIFRSLTSRFSLPSNRSTWESLTSYSFVRPAGEGYVQLHQLMAVALRERLSIEAMEETHRELRQIWEGRRAFREAAYHASRSGELSGEDLLLYADQIRASGGAREISGLIGDVRPTLELEDGLLCLRAEHLVLLGDAPRAIALIGSRDHGVGSTIAERLAIAAAHARRIAGETDAALEIYRAVWERGTSETVATAGLWTADLHMAQGRFATAMRVADEVLGRFPEANPELRGDLARLTHLAGRFSYDFDLAEARLEEAARWYSQAGSAVGEWALLTNRAELLAWSQPDSAVSAANDAIAAHAEHGAQHELGKSYTALALAELRLGNLHGAEIALDAADEALTKAQYRSGLARAGLLRAFLLARRGRLDDAADRAHVVVAEFVGARVYPTMILVAEELLELIGLPHPSVSAEADHARSQLEADFTDQTRAASASLLGLDPRELLQAALREHVPSAGYYNRNVRVDDLLVRVRIPGAATMDLQIWEEHALLASIQERLAPVPRLRFASRRPAFQVHDYVEGVRLDDIARRGQQVPGEFLDAVAVLFRDLANIRDGLPPLPERWPVSGDTLSFASRLREVTESVYLSYRDSFAPTFEELGIPTNPFAVLDEAWSSFTDRPFCLVHADIHRKNVIVKPDGTSIFIDWELALFGDPVYDLAVHLHKMGYDPGDEQVLVHRWLAAMPSEVAAGWELDVPAYLTHERIKSAIVDSVRYTEQLRDPDTSEVTRQELLAKLTHKVNVARAIWQSGPGLEVGEVKQVVMAHPSIQRPVGESDGPDA